MAEELFFNAVFSGKNAAFSIKHYPFFRFYKYL